MSEPSGYLGLVDLIGGSVLSVLLGSDGWKDNTTARLTRLSVGSLVIGLPLGVLMAVLGKITGSEVRAAAGLFYGLFLSVVVTFFLEGLRRKMNGE